MSEISQLVPGLATRWFLITLFIMVDLVVSVWQALKEKNFDIKKLPQFASEWVMAILAITLVDAVACYVSSEKSLGLLVYLFVGLRELVLVTILLCYLKKIFESCRAIGWSVPIESVEEVIDTAQDAVKNKVKDTIQCQVAGATIGEEKKDE